MWNGIVLSCLMWHMSWSAIMPHYHRVTLTNQRPSGWCPANQMTDSCLLITTQTWTNLRFVYIIFSLYLIFGFWIKEGLWSGGRLSHVTGASWESDLDFPKWTAINAVVIRIKWQFTQSPSITTNLMISYWSEAISLKTKWSTKPSWSPKHKTIAKKIFPHWGSLYPGDMQDMQVSLLGYSVSENI